MLVNDEDSLSASTLSNVSEQVELQKKGGRPVGTTIIAKRMLDKCVVAAKNEVTMKYKAAFEEAREKGKKCKRHTIKTLIDEVAEKRKLPSDFVSVDGIRKRVFRCSTFIPLHKSRGLSSPLLTLEPTILEVVLQMA